MNFKKTLIGFVVFVLLVAGGFLFINRDKEDNKGELGDIVDVQDPQPGDKEEDTDEEKPEEVATGQLSDGLVNSLTDSLGQNWKRVNIEALGMSTLIPESWDYKLDGNILRASSPVEGTGKLELFIKFDKDIQNNQENLRTYYEPYLFDQYIYQSGVQEYRLNGYKEIPTEEVLDPNAKVFFDQDSLEFYREYNEPKKGVSTIEKNKLIGFKAMVNNSMSVKDDPVSTIENYTVMYQKPLGQSDGALILVTSFKNGAEYGAEVAEFIVKNLAYINDLDENVGSISFDSTQKVGSLLFSVSEDFEVWQKNSERFVAKVTNDLTSPYAGTIFSVTKVNENRFIDPDVQISLSASDTLYKIPFLDYYTKNSNALNNIKETTWPRLSTYEYKKLITTEGYDIYIQASQMIYSADGIYDINLPKGIRTKAALIHNGNQVYIINVVGLYPSDMYADYIINSVLKQARFS